MIHSVSQNNDFKEELKIITIHLNTQQMIMN